MKNDSIQYLLSYGMGLGLFKGTHTMEEARDRVLTLVDKLKNSCLLLDGLDCESFSVHDVVRDVAISIASRDQHVIAKTNIESPPREWLNKDTLKICTAISLLNCKIGELVEGLECPRLEFFHMSPKEPFIKIPDNCFTGLTELRVLDFDEMHLLPLPPSLHLLANLQTLCLDYCILGDVAIVGELKQLEILSFQGSNIDQLPREIGHLTRLRLLDLSFCYQLKAIPSNVISNLSKLEELYMGDTFVQWEIEGQNSSEKSRASLHELKHLPRLTTLKIHIQDPKALPKDWLSQKLERYVVLIGDEWNWPDRYGDERILILKLNTSICLKDEFFMRLKGLEELCLDEVQGVKNVVYELDREGFPRLKHLHIQNNPHFLCIVDSTGLVRRDAFPLLESLSLNNLMSLEKICCGQLKVESFCRLIILKVDSCEKLTNIFSFSITRGLPQLQIIEVIACKNMKEIFAVAREDENNNSEGIEFGQLRKLTLKSLSQLRRFCSVVKKFHTLQRQQELLTSGTLSNEVIQEDESDTSTSFFNEKIAFPNLETLKISAINTERIWHNQLPAMSSCIQNLTRLIVKSCGNLKYLFSSSVVRSFVQLQHLEICKCMDLEEIVFPEELVEEERKDIMFPQLNFLRMKDLAKLTRFCSGNCIEFPSLKQLQIKKCPDLKAFLLQNISSDMTAVEIQPFFNEKVVLPSLEELVISNMGNLKMIWHTQFSGESFCKLEQMEVKFCTSLLTIFPPNMFGRFSKLELLTVTDCDDLEEIFDLRGLNSEETHSGAVSQLRELRVFCLPSLTKIWNKDPQGKLIFENIVLVRIFDCHRLKNIFPASIAKSLVQLEKISINSCQSLEEIVANEGRADEATTTFVFPSLTFLRLCDLPFLATFYSGMHTIEWPELKKLEVYDCEVFTSECLSFQEIHEGQLANPAQKTLFLVEKVFPNLEELTLSKDDFTIILQQAQLRKLKVLQVVSDGSSVFEVGLLQNIHNLEKLVLSHCAYEEEIFSRGDVEEHAERLAQIKSLKLNGIDWCMEHLWKPDSKLDSFLQNLEILGVKECDSLINLVPSSASFRNLTALKVCGCSRLISLVTPQTAKSLVQLKEMRLSGCFSLEEIVANEGDTDDEIVFTKLKWLFLERLSSLASFCSGNYTFNFPSLEDLILTNCPKMKTFSAGALKTPMLRAVQNYELNKECWAGDLNTTLQHLHEKMAKCPKTEVEEESETSASEETEEEENVEGHQEAERPVFILETDEDEDYEEDGEEF